MAPKKALHVPRPSSAPPAHKPFYPSAAPSSLPAYLLAPTPDASTLQGRGPADSAGAYGISEDEAGPLIAADSSGKAEVADENGSLVSNQAGV